jgi:hypothetical protein
MPRPLLLLVGIAVSAVTVGVWAQPDTGERPAPAPAEGEQPEPTTPTPTPTTPPAVPEPTPPAPTPPAPYPYPYPYPYAPYSGYPAQPGGYPPPSNYPPGWYPPTYYAPEPDRPKVAKKRYPEDAAAQTSPFFDALAGGTTWDERYSNFLAVGAQVGGYLGGWVRVAPKALLFASEPEDDNTSNFDGSFGGNGFSPDSSEPASFLYGASLGVALVRGTNFVMAPGVLFLRTDQGDYGSFLGLELPFEWVTDSGARFGFVVSVGRAFGGEFQATCFDGSTQCDPGEQRLFDREGGAGFYSHFQIGWGMGHPEPL